MFHPYINFPPGQSSSATTPVVFSNFLWTKFYNIAPIPSINGPGYSGWGSLIGTAGAYDPINFGRDDSRITISDNFGVVSKGYIYSDTSTIVTFQTVSDDGVVLLLNGTNVISNWTYHGGTNDYSSSVTLPVGYTPIELRMFQGGGGAICQLYWSVGSTGIYTSAGTGRMFHTAIDAL